MTERSTFDPFEQRIARELERYVAPAADPKPAIEIAAVAMRPRRPVVRAQNTSRPRRFLLHQYRAADAWPLIHPPTNWDEWQSLLVGGEETLEPRMTAVPVRLPYPPAPNQGSIYENQRDLATRFFKDPIDTATEPS